MAPRLTPCTCTTNVLLNFINRVACIDVISAVHSSSNIRVLLSARYYSRTPHPLRPHNSSQYDVDESIPASTVSRRKQRPFKSSANIPREGEWAMGGTVKEICTTSVPGKAHYHEDVTAVLELTPKSINELAAESSEDGSYSRPSERGPVGEAKPKRLQNSMKMKGFALHHSSLPTVPPPQSRSLKIRNPKSPRFQVLNSRTEAQYRNLVAERKLWQTQKEALEEKFEDGWKPRKKLSPDALAGIRAIHAQFPEQYTTSILAEKFEVSPEAIRRILKSRWIPKEEEVLDRQRRWFLRGQKVWSRCAELGLKPPKRWRKLGIGKRNDAMAMRKNRQSVDTKITVRNVNQALQGLNENPSTVSVTMAERIL